MEKSSGAKDSKANLASAMFVLLSPAGYKVSFSNFE